MKLKFSLKEQEVSLEAGVENLVEKSMEQKALQPERKTRYQIKQEEKRKNKELEQKQRMQMVWILMSIVFVGLIIGIVATILGI